MTNYCKLYNINLRGYKLDENSIIHSYRWFQHIEKKKYYKKDNSYIEVGGKLGSKNYFVGYYCNGELHRENGPAFIEVKNGELIECLYQIHGKAHNVYGPAVITTTDNSVYETWMINGEQSRFNGPAFIETDKRTGAVLCEAFFIEDNYLLESEYWKLVDFIRYDNGRGIGKAKKKDLKLLLEIAKFYNKPELIDKIESKLLLLALQD